jgi:hypothetical protein
MLRREDRSTPVLAPLAISAPLFPSISLLSGSLDQLLSSALELEADDDESPEERAFYGNLESYLGRSGSVSKRRRSESISSWSRECRSCLGMCGLVELELISR